VFFVRDGHHRVSVLKELGATTVQAIVTELDTPVHLSPHITEEELDLKAECAAFLLETNIAEVRPEERIEFTLPGQFQKLYEHMGVHRYFLGLHEQREIPYPEAVVRWYDDVYSPVVRVIREEGILDHFPGRTESDLYLWIIEHQHYMRERSDQQVPLEQAAAEFSREFSRGSGKRQLEIEAERLKQAQDPTP
jgi:hypothetical protein